MADLPDDGAAIRLAATIKRLDEALMEARRNLEGIGELRPVPRNLGIFVSGAVLTGAIPSLPEGIGELIAGSIDEYHRSLIKDRLSGQIWDNDN